MPTVQLPGLQVDGWVILPEMVGLDSVGQDHLEAGYIELVAGVSTLPVAHRLLDVQIGDLTDWHGQKLRAVILQCVAIGQDGVIRQVAAAENVFSKFGQGDVDELRRNGLALHRIEYVGQQLFAGGFGRLLGGQALA